MDRKTEFKKKRNTKMILMFVVPGIAFVVGSYLAFDFLFSTCRGGLIYTATGISLYSFYFFLFTRLRKTLLKYFYYAFILASMLFFSFSPTINYSRYAEEVRENPDVEKGWQLNFPYVGNKYLHLL